MPAVLFVLRGTLSGYQAPTTSTDGAIKITVASSNFGAKALAGTTVTFAITSKTKVVLHGLTTVTDGDRGIVKIRAPKGSVATVLQTSPALQVIDQAPSK